MWYDELDHLDLANHTSRMQDTTEEIKNEQDVLIDEFEDGEEVVTECFDHIEKLVGSIDYLNTKGRADRLFMVMYDREMVEMGYPSVESLEEAGMEGFIRDAYEKIKEWIANFFEWLKGLWKKFWRMFGFYKEKVEEKTEEVKKTPELPPQEKKEVPEDKWVASPTEIEKIAIEFEREIRSCIEKNDLAGLKACVASTKKKLKQSKYDPKKLSQNEVLHMTQVTEKLYSFASTLEVDRERATKASVKDLLDDAKTVSNKFEGDRTSNVEKELNQAIAHTKSYGQEVKLVDQAILDIVKDAVKTMDGYLYANNKHYRLRSYRDGDGNHDEFIQHIADKDATLVID
jgi:hypothetical protein